MRTALVLIAALLTVTLSGCKGKCRELSEKLCECEPNTPLREACISRIAVEESRVGVTSEDEKVCAALVDKCDCRNLHTLEGKQACGLAY